MKGIFPALLTPFDSRNHIDEGALAALVNSLVDRGVRGFYVCGSTGEAFLLEMAERMRILEVVVAAAAGRAAIICHVGAIGTDLSLTLGRHAASVGVDAISSIPPFYYKFSPDEIVSYYMDLADGTGLPVIPYNFPALSGVTLSGELMSRLRRNPGIIGVKFTSNDLFQLERMKKEDPGLLVYNGFDEIFLAGLSMGADGAIGSTFNFMPEKFLAIRQHFEAGNREAARTAQEGANEVIQTLIATGKMLNAQKYLLGLQGIPFGECRKPFLPLTETDRKNLDAIAARQLVHPAR
jgi:N-acetylneuraminate lyase